MTRTGYKERIIDRQIEQALRLFGAVSIEGPKWCGKTWTALRHAKSAVYLNNVESNFNERKLAEMDVSTVLEGEDTPILIDEWQEVPAIWDGVRFRCDQDPKKGQYILTGSATPVTDQIHHSGAGRIFRAKMRTMSLYESGQSSGVISLRDLFDRKIKNMRVEETKLRRIAELIVRGGWPQSVDLDEADAMFMATSYIDAVLSSDMSRVDGVTRDAKKMRMVMHSLARNESTIATDTTIERDIEEANGEISRPTVNEYINVLEKLYLIEHQPAFSVNVRSSARVGKANKHHFADPSLVCAILNINSQKLLNDINFFGLMFESLATHDLRVYAGVNDGQVYHYRDSAGLEIDAIVELRDGSYGAFEIKLGTDRLDEAAANLLKFQENVERKPEFLAIITGLGEAVYTRPDGVIVLPLTALKD